MPSSPAPAARPVPGSPSTPSETGWERLTPLVVMLVTLVILRGIGSAVPPTLSYSRFFELARTGHVASVTLTGDSVTGKLAAPMLLDTAGVSVTAATFVTLLPAREDRELLPLLRARGVQVTVQPDQPPLLVSLFAWLAPWVLGIGLWIWLSARAQGGMAGSMVGKALKARGHRFESETEVSVTFDDVAGLAGAKRDLREVVDFLKDPGNIHRLGGKVPHGVLLFGPPGTGKTLLARAVAGEAGVPFFSISASEFVELFVGMGAARVRDLFSEAKKVAPSIVFIDEIDAIGRARGSSFGGGSDEREQTLNQLLSELDGFTRNDLTIVLAATNRPELLDAALLRPGRFDRRVVIDRPEVGAREAILGVHTRGKPLGDDVDLHALAAATPGFSGADLANLANEAALLAARRGALQIGAVDMRAAYDKIVLGDLRETKLEPGEKNRVALHEAGHAVAAYFTPGSEPPDRVSIIPRGLSLGVTHQAPGVDRHLLTRPELEGRLAVLMGGMAAEQVTTGLVSSGAQDDLKKATDIAFEMVAHFGMSERVGPMYFERGPGSSTPMRARADDGATSEGAARMLEEEAAAVLAQALDRARALVTHHRAALDRLAAALLERETVERVDLDALLGSIPDEGQELP